jgi:Na+-driven multidrug efflux pump
MKIGDLGNDVIRMISALIFGCSILIVAPLFLYGLLWISSLGVPHRINPVGDLYASAWSGAAFGLALFHCRQSYLIMNRPDLRATIIMLITSGIVTVTCPAFWLY